MSRADDAVDALLDERLEMQARIRQMEHNNNRAAFALNKLKLRFEPLAEYIDYVIEMLVPGGASEKEQP